MLILVENNLNKAINLQAIIQLLVSAGNYLPDFVPEIQSITTTVPFQVTF